MNPEDLNDDEMLALLCLCRVMVAADGELGIEEMEELNQIGIDLGIEAFTRNSKRADDEEQSVEHALALAAGVDRAGARDMILTMLSDLAAVDGIDSDETALLDKLRGIWA